MDLGELTQGKQVMFRDSMTNGIELFGELMLATVALLIPLVALSLFLTT
jgi:hypothetical protein